MPLVLPDDFSALLQAVLDGGPLVGFAYTPANGVGEPELVAGPEEPPADALSELFGSAQDLNLVVGSLRVVDGQLYAEVSDTEHPSFAADLVSAEVDEPLLADLAIVALGSLEDAGGGEGGAAAGAATDDDGWDDWGDDDWGEAEVLADEAPAPAGAVGSGSGSGAGGGAAGSVPAAPAAPSLAERVDAAFADRAELSERLAALRARRVEISALLGPRAPELARARAADRTFHQLLGFVRDQGGKASFRQAWGMLDELVPALQGAAAVSALLADPLAEQAELARALEEETRAAADLDLGLALLIQEAEAEGHLLPWADAGALGALAPPPEGGEGAAEAVISAALDRLDGVVAGAKRFRLEARSSTWQEHVGAGLADLDLEPLTAWAATGARSAAAEELFDSLDEGRKALEEALSAARNASGWADRLPRRQRKVAERNLLALGAECHAWLVAARAAGLLTEDF